MKRFFVLAALLALLGSAPALACGAGKGQMASECPLGMKGIEKSAQNMDNGVKITMSAKDAAAVKQLQAAMASEDKETGCDCPMHAKGVSHSVQNTSNGVVLTLTSGDKEQVKTLQAFAASNCGKGECPHAKGARAAESHGECPHAKEAAAKADRT